MAINQLYLIKSGENSFVEETGAIISISGGQVGIGTNFPESYFHVTGDAQVDGSLVVKGDFKTINETTIQVDDKNIELGFGANSDSDVDGGGITLKGLTDKTITWQTFNNSWNFNTGISVSGSGFFGHNVNVSGNIGIGQEALAYNLEVLGSGNFTDSLYIQEQPVLTGVEEDLSKWTPVLKNSDKTLNIDISGDGGDYNFYGDVNGKDPEIKVFVGDSLVFNNIGLGHPLEIKDSDGNIISSELGQETIFNADSEGIYSYYCTAHPNLMSGTISVSRYKEIYYNEGNVGIGTNDPNYKLDVIGQGHFSDDLLVAGNPVLTGNNFDDGLFVSGNPVLTGTTEDLGKWEDGDTGKIYYTGGFVGVSNDSPSFNLHVSGDAKIENSLKVGNAFDLSQNGNLSNNTPNIGDAIKWDGSKWIPGFVSSNNGGGGGVSVPSPFVRNLTSGQSIHAISFGQTFNSIPGIATDLETNGEGGIIPYTISGVSTTGYHAVFTAPIPNNFYRIHTVFGGAGSQSSDLWETGDNSSIYYNNGDVSVQRNFNIGGNLNVNGTTTTINTQTVEIEDHNLVIAANTGYNQLTSEYPGDGGAYAGILWGTGDAGSASPVSLTYQTNKGFAFEGGNVGIGTTNPGAKLEVDYVAASQVGLTLNGSNTALNNAIKLTDASDNEIILSINAGNFGINGGNVGIGTTNPSTKLEVAAPVMSIFRNTNIVGLSNGLHFKFGDSASADIPQSYASIGAVIENSNTGSHDGALAFTTAKSGVHTVAEERMRIDSDGNVGIGTTDPNAKLEIRGASANSEYLRVGGANSAASRALRFSSFNSGADDSGHIINAPSSGGEIQFQTNGADAMRIDSDGNVGIGTTDPGAKLSIVPSSNNGFALEVCNSSGTPRGGFYINADNGSALHLKDNSSNTDIALNTTGPSYIMGNVGIGTNDPGAKLELVDAVDGDVSIFIHNNDTTSGSSAQTSSIDFKFARTGSSTIRRTGAKIVAGKEGEWNSTSASQDGYLELYTTNSASSNPAMRIDSSGNVGIGTTSPVTLLDLNKPKNDAQGNPLNEDVIISFSKGDTGEARIGLAGATSQVLSGALTDDLCIRTDGNNIRFGTAAATKTDMSILTNGNVGIGTTSPDQKLEIFGGALKFGTNAAGLNEFELFPTDEGSNGLGFYDRTNSAYRMLISNAGNVGIGTTNPVGLLHISSDKSYASPFNYREDPLVKIENTANAEPAVLSFVADDSSANNRYGNILFYPNNTAASSYFAINADVQEANHLVIKGGGNVGIGTTSPAGKLEVYTENNNTGSTYGNLADSLLLKNTSDMVGAGPKLIFYNANNPGSPSSSPSALIGLQRVNNANHRGDLVFHTRSAIDPEERMRIDSNGNVGIGTTSPSYTFHVEKDASYPAVVAKGINIGAGWGSYISSQTNNSGAIRAATIGSYRPTTDVNFTGTLQMMSRNAVSNYLWCDDSSNLRTSTSSSVVGGGTGNGTVIGDQTSDERLKNIESNFDYGLEQVMQLKPIAYTFKDDQDATRRLGFGAQTTKDIVPEAVYDTQECIDGYDVDPEDEHKQIARSEDTKLAMKYVELVPVLTKAIQEQQTIIEDLRAQNESLIQRIENLENK